MLTIKPLSAGAQAYYVKSVDTAWREDYYLGRAEAPGEWIGGGAESLGLEGPIGTDEAGTAAFHAVMTDGADPRTGEVLGRRWAAQKVPSYDLVFAAPKGVSVMYAVAPDELRDRIGAAHEDAARQAFGWLERNGAWVRRGHGGTTRLATTGLTAASFLHRVSRAGDPHLHSHYVVSARAQGVDGQWSSLDGRPFFALAKTAGTLYQAALRDNLRDLGLTWTVDKGMGEPDCVCHTTRRGFSRRAEEIEAELAKTGQSGRRAKQQAWAKTRQAKGDVNPATLRYEWLVRGEELGFGRGDLLAAVRDGRDRELPDKAEAGARAVVDLVGPEGLTLQASTFASREVLQGVASSMVDGASVRDVEDLADRVLASPELVPLDTALARARRGDVIQLGASTGRPRGTAPAGVQETRYTTTGLLAVEQRVLETAVRGRGAGAGVVEEPHLAAALGASVARGKPLRDEQERMVRALTTSGDRVTVVNALGGAGKTTALGAAARAWEAAGYPIVGTSLSAKAAGVLADETGIRTTTLARFLLDVDDPRNPGVAPGTVVVVDEAGQVGSRDLWRVLRAVDEAGGKLALVGDVHQLPEIDAGGAFRAFVGDSGRGIDARLPVVTLTTNARQKDPEERARLAELRCGDVETAMRSYEAAGRVLRADDAEQLRSELVARWADVFLGLTPEEEGQTVAQARMGVEMVTLTNRDAVDLNNRARLLLADAGLLAGPTLEADLREYRAGDHVLTRQNDYRLGGVRGQRVLNGERWEVLAVDADAGTLDVRLIPSRVGLPSRDVTLPADYVAGGNVDHAYALTANISQGSTWRTTFVLGSEQTYREAGYTAASRAWETTLWHLVRAVDDDGCGHAHHSRDSCGQPGCSVHTAGDEQDPLQGMIGALERSAGQTLAHDTVSPDTPVHLRVANGELAGRRLGDLYAERRALEVVLRRGAPADARRDLTLAERGLASARTELGRATNARELAEEERRAAPTRRRGLLRRPDRVGVARADRVLTVATGREDVWRGRVDELSARVEQLRAAAAEHARHVEGRAPELARLSALDVAIHARRDELGARVAGDGPRPDVVELLGRAPVDPGARAEWLDAATDAEAFRDRYAPDPVEVGAGPAVAGEEERAGLAAAVETTDDLGTLLRQRGDAERDVEARRLLAAGEDRPWTRAEPAQRSHGIGG